MRILAVYRHFWPDSPPYASMLRTVTARLAEKGHSVTMLAEQPGYKSTDRAIDVPHRERIDDVDVRRLSRLPFSGSRVMRRIAAGVFPLRVVLHAAASRIRGERYDLLWTSTMPPAINGWGGRIAARILGAKFVYHFNDIYPELQVYAGNWRADSMLTRVIGWIDRRNAKRALLCIALSEDMAETIAARGIEREKIIVINNFMLASFTQEEPLPERFGRSTDTFRVIFAGNVGRFQGLEALVDAARLLAVEKPEIEFIILGEGTALNALEKRAEGLSNIRFEGHMPFEIAKSVIASADLGLVSIQPGVYRAAYPSKTLTYLGLGVPVLAMVEPHSSLAREIEENEVGWVASGPDGVALAHTIASVHEADEDATLVRARVLQHYALNLSREAALQKWCSLVEKVGKP